jgi:hypothetical protein
MRASIDRQGESFRGHEGRGCKSKVMHQMFEGCRVAIGMCQCLIGSTVKWCLNVIDRITHLTMYSIGRVGG